MAELVEVSSAKCFGGIQKVYSHQSTELQCKMNFGAFIPPQALAGEKVPVLYWLSGLTCTEANFIQKSSVQKYAAEHGLLIINPDTSPRGCNIEGDSESWDFGVGAGFYVDATTDKWKTNYRMYSYVTKELPHLVNAKLPVQVADKRAISGHSMGGLGALICYLKNPGMYTSVSAFAPICNPSNCPWGKKAFTGYLGEDTKAWQQYDPCYLIEHFQGSQAEILVDQGDQDNFLKEQLLSDNLRTACEGKHVALKLRMQPGYDHSYFFIATFIEDHIKHHAKHLKH